LIFSLSGGFINVLVVDILLWLLFRRGIKADARVEATRNAVVVMANLEIIVCWWWWWW
jgi:hypothetical protein